MKFSVTAPKKKSQPVSAGILELGGLAGAKNPILSGLTDGLKKFTHHLTHHKILAGRRGFKCNFPHFPLLTFFYGRSGKG